MEEIHLKLGEFWAVGALGLIGVCLWLIPLSRYAKAIAFCERAANQWGPKLKREWCHRWSEWVEIWGIKSDQTANVRRGEELRKWVWQLETLEEGRSRKVTSQIPEFPHYKNFTRQLEVLLAAKHHFGSPIRESMGRLKRELIQDLEFEKKLGSALASHHLQYFLSATAIWSFVLIQQSLFSASLSWTIYLLCLFWQLLGWFLLRLVLGRVRKWCFRQLEELGLCLGTLSLLIGVGLSQKKILEHSGVDQLPEFRHRELHGLKERLNCTLWRWKHEGRGLEEELQFLLNDLQFLRQKKYEDFQRILKGGSFAILALFALPSFFIVMLGLVQSFLPEMSAIS